MSGSMKRRIALIALTAFVLGLLAGCGSITGAQIEYYPPEAAKSAPAEPSYETKEPGPSSPAAPAVSEAPDGSGNIPEEDGEYSTKADVALYIHTYGRLPENFITKEEARALGWTGGSVERFAPGKSIGGSYFGNFEQLLPSKDGREYYECDIDTLGMPDRGAKRIVYSNDGLIYYTEDHYGSFTLLYGEDQE